MLNNAYQNLELKIDLLSGGTIAGLKEKIKSVLGYKILILCGLSLSGTPKLPAVCEPNIYVTQTEEPDDWDEEEDGEFVPEDVYHLEASNIYGYDIAIEDNVVTCTATQSATYDGVQTMIESGTIENAKPIYWHTIKFQRGGTAETSTFSRILGYMIILTNSDDPITLDGFKEILSTSGFYGVLINGKASNTPSADLTSLDDAVAVKYSTDTIFTAVLRNASNVEYEVDFATISGWVLFEDLGANKIN